jgi:hypothetical protein
MPRSGTTLVEQILASHPRVHGAGELKGILEIAHLVTTQHPSAPYPVCLSGSTEKELRQYAAAYLDELGRSSADALRVVDKMPRNFLHLGLVQTLFPRARVIHLRRDPLDTCLSIYFHNFSNAFPYACDLGSLGRYYRRYTGLMQHWREVLTISVMEIRYESLVNNPEDEIRRLLDFCGLDWDTACLRFYETGRDIDTPSYRQVRKPVYRNSVSRWKKYEAHLGPLREALGTPVPQDS